MRGPTDRPENHFTMIGHTNTRNAGETKLTGLAMALHHYLLSLPADWTVTVDQVAEDVFTEDSLERVRRAARELRNAGLLILHTERAKGGQFTKWYETFHIPQPAENRTPSKSQARTPKQTPSNLTSRRVSHVWSDQAKREFPQVAPDVEDPTVGFPTDIQKTAAEDCGKDGSEDRSPDGAQPPAAPRVLSVDSKIRRVAKALAEAGEGPEDLSDEDKVLIYDGYVLGATKPVRSPHRFLVALFQKAASEVLLEKVRCNPPCPACGKRHGPAPACCGYCLGELKPDCPNCNPQLRLAAAPATSATGLGTWPPKCGNCDEFRFIPIGDDAVARCPACHPREVGQAA